MGRIIFFALNAAAIVLCRLRNVQRTGVTKGPENALEHSNDV